MAAVAAHFPAHEERADRVLTDSLQQTLRLLAFRASGAGPKGRRPAATKMQAIELPISHILTDLR
jgi:hypothetical protein